VYTWAITKSSTSAQKINAMKQIQWAYTWTSLASNNNIANVLNKTTNSELLVLSSTTFKLPPASLDWACWTDNWWNLTSSPTNSCAIWSISNLVDNWPWSTYTWSCNWSNWWVNTICSANHLPVINWTCWTSAWLNLTTVPTSNLCNTWTLSGTVADNWPWSTYAWSCNWSNWWTNSSCTANNTNSTYPWCSIPDIHYLWYIIAWCNVWATTPSWYGTYTPYPSCPAWYHLPNFTESAAYNNISLPRWWYLNLYFNNNQVGIYGYYRINNGLSNNIYVTNNSYTYYDWTQYRWANWRCFKN